MGALGLAAQGAWAELLDTTPAQTEGPFYPNQLPLDTDNDLLILNDAITPAVGEVTHLTGRVLSTAGEPVRNVAVEIWQCDNNGVYIHTGCPGQDKRDGNFQGFGRFLTDSEGRYYFRTIKPVPYGTGGFVRTPHIHFQLHRGGREILTTQMYVAGHPQNERDGVFRGLRNPADRDALLVEFKPLPNSKAGELTAHFEIVLGVTPRDEEHA